LNVYSLAMLLIKKTFASLLVTETFILMQRISYAFLIIDFLLSAIKLNVTRTLYCTPDV